MAKFLTRDAFEGVKVNVYLTAEEVSSLLAGERVEAANDDEGAGSSVSIAALVITVNAGAES